LSPEQYIKLKILAIAMEFGEMAVSDLDNANVEDLYETLSSDGSDCESKELIRVSGVETFITPTSTGMKINGWWVGWDLSDGEFDWMQNSYWLKYDNKTNKFKKL